MRTARSVCGILTAALLVCALTGCGNHTADVASLETTLRHLQGVSKVTTDAEAGDPFFPGSASFEVSADESASLADVRRILITGLDAADEHFGHDEVDVVVYHRSGEYRLHAQNPSVGADDLARVLRFAQRNINKEEGMVLDIEAMEKNDEDLTSSMEVQLPRGSTRHDVLPRLDDFSEPPKHTDVSVHAVDGSALSGFDGLPTDEARSLWSELNKAPYAESYRVDLAPLNISPGSSRAAMVLVTLGREPHAAAIRNRHRVAFMTAQLAALRAWHGSYRYYVNKGFGAEIQLDQGACGTHWKGWRGEVARLYAANPENCPG